MSTAEQYRRVAWAYLKLAEATSNPKTGASLVNLADYCARQRMNFGARMSGRLRWRPNVMQFRLATAAAAVALLVAASASVFAADRIAQDDVCTGSKPFREVAQDETRTMAELCMMREEFLREDRGWKDTPPEARRQRELPHGWAQSGNNIQMRRGR